MNKNQLSQFDRIITLVGEEKYKFIKEKNILVVGIGGVGGYAVESLVRSGIESITIVDYDTIDITNLNRQIIALHSTIGMKKIDVMKKRILDINPNCKVNVLDIKLDSSNYSVLFEEKYDYIIDCCDSIEAKKTLISESVKRNIPIISSMGTANRFDPTKLEILDIRKTINDPLARKLRKFVKDENINKKIMVLSSKEVPMKNGIKLGSNSYVPPCAGLFISSYVINNILK